jgi:glycerol-3-phosphate dehydrogenase
VAGLITVAGGKYTTYRVMAKDAIDMVGRNLDMRVPPSCTDELPLIGADGYEGYWNRRKQIGSESGLHIKRIEHLLTRYGTRIDDILELIDAHPQLADPIPGTKTYLCAEARYAAQCEGALHLDDVLTRRTRISIETFDRGLGAAERVAREMGAVLGWDDETREREIDHYRKRVDAERESQQQPDDLTADAARLGAPDLRTGRRPKEAPLLHLANHRPDPTK